MTDFDIFDQSQANREGWGIVDDGDGKQICRVGDLLMSDYEAWAIVAGQANRGSLYHAQALALIAVLNPAERNMIRAATGY